MLTAPPRSSALVLATPPGSVPMGWPRHPRIGNWDGNEQAEPMRFHEPSRHVVWLPSEGYFALPYDEGAVHVACIWLGRARATWCARGAPNFFPSVGGGLERAALPLPRLVSGSGCHTTPMTAYAPPPIPTPSTPGSTNGARLIPVHVQIDEWNATRASIDSHHLCFSRVLFLVWFHD